MASDPRPPYRRILVTRMKFIGDVVLTTPLIRSLRQAFPDAHIAYLAERGAVSLLEHNPFLDTIIGYDYSRPSALEQVRVARILRRNRFDLTLDLWSNPRSALLTFLSGAPVRVGLERHGRGRLYTVTVRDDGAPKTAVEFYNQFLDTIGVPPVAWRPELFVTDEERADIRRTVLSPLANADGAGPLVAIHPGATWPAKRWYPERFAELADRLIDQAGTRVVLTGGPNDRAAVAEVQRRSRHTLPHTGILALRRLAAVLDQSDAFVTNDGGPMHIAAALGTPTIGLFGPGQEEIWFPYPHEEGHRALRENVSCHPCHLNVCNRPGEEYMECMKLLSVDAVFRAVQRALEARRDGPAR